MKLESVKMILNISIESEELSKYIKALDNITSTDKGMGDIATLNRFIIKLKEVQKDSRDY
ncbi:hypothetical protein LCGC14_2223520 [marine sediment metagenome]|uniref:Uncharacterized protein n=1 Tax=marine sediment metagenome TaxID=412755 RepID=A0A0F9FMU7_9ZZZZ